MKLPVKLEVGDEESGEWGESEWGESVSIHFFASAKRIDTNFEGSTEVSGVRRWESTGEGEIGGKLVSIHFFTQVK